MSTIAKAGDTHSISWRVQAAGAPLDLTGATVRLLARATWPRGDLLELAATVPDPVGGLVEHVLSGNLAVGVYDVELEVTRAGVITTAPTATFERLTIVDDLG